MLTVLFHSVLQMRVLLYENNKSCHRSVCPNSICLITLLLINDAILFS